MVGTSVVYNGYKYWRALSGKDSRYYKRVSRGRVIYLHRQVYEDAYGEIPEGYEIHHINEDTHDNNPDNLVAVVCRKHKQSHGRVWTQAKQDNMDRIRPLTKAWHSTPEGKKWHVDHARRAYKKRKPVQKYCKVCGKSFEDITRRTSSRFCSNACKSKYRRDSGLDNIEKNCPICGQTFQTSKYKPSTTCSRGCANTYRSRK